MNNADKNDFALWIKAFIPIVTDGMVLVKTAYEQAIKQGFRDDQALAIALTQFKQIIGVYSNGSSSDDNDDDSEWK